MEEEGLGHWKSSENRSLQTGEEISSMLENEGDHSLHHTGPRELPLARCTNQLTHPVRLDALFPGQTRLQALTLLWALAKGTWRALALALDLQFSQALYPW